MTTWFKAAHLACDEINPWMKHGFILEKFEKYWHRPDVCIAVADAV